MTTTTTTTSATGPGGLSSLPPAPPAGPAGPPRLRRRPMLVAAAVVTVCVGALTGVWLYSSTRAAADVVGVARSVARGELIGREDLVVVRVGADPALHPVAADRLEQVVGQRAAQDLAAGGLLTDAALTAAVVPGRGMSMVGVVVPAGMTPAGPVLAGDAVRLVATPGSAVDVGPADPATVAASVVSVRAGEAGASVVDVLLPRADAPVWAARAATGRVALVLDSRER